MTDSHQKITNSHLLRDAYLYVRQSTLRQVIENTESTKRQYALRERAIRLGWPTERIVVIDCDLGQSGASSSARDGFQKLISEVSMSRVGVVLGLEVSRLARNNVDWHRLLEICALTETLILDEDGLYDPRHFNDRLLLGMKGSFSEAELYILRARLQGGIEAKARRGELKKPLPVGLVYDQQKRVILDPDRQVQEAIHTFFKTFERTEAASATIKYFAGQGLLFPRRLRHGTKKGQVIWVRLVHSRACQILKNPWYAGAYVHGRTKARRKPDGKLNLKRLPQDQWDTVLPNSHPGYISWEQFERNRQQLKKNAQAYGTERRCGPPREGPALLQGLTLCGVCGKPMTLRYDRRQAAEPRYMCQRDGIETGERICQSIPGASIDRLIGELVLELVEPITLDVALAVQKELEGRLEDADRLRRQQVERARYQADLARERFLLVDARNRLVADTLEADWNDKLRELDQMQQEHDRQSQTDREVMNEQVQEKIRSLATNFPRIWREPATPQRERKRMIRLLIEDVTLTKTEQITLGIRLRGGAALTRTLPLPLQSWKTWRTDPEVVKLIDELLDGHTDQEIAAKLNERGLCSGKGVRFTPALVARVRQSYRLRSRYDRLRDTGLCTVDEMADQLGVCSTTVKKWARRGLLRSVRYNDKNQFLYSLIDGQIPVKKPGRKRNDPGRI